MNVIILQNHDYHFLKQPWLVFDEVKELVWDMYSELVYESIDESLVPSWDYFIEDENPFTVFYDEVMSYLAFGDFNYYQYPNSEEEVELFYEKCAKHGNELDEDCIYLFDEMRLFMQDTSNTYQHHPIVTVW